MKKFICLLMVAVLALASPMAVFALDSTPVDTNNILKELNKITDNEKKEKIEQLYYTVLYTKTYVDDEIPINNKTSSNEAIQYLNKFSGDELDKQISKQLKDIIESKIQDPDVSFSDEAVSLVEIYCPEEVDKVKAKTVPVAYQLDPDMKTAAASSSYYKEIRHFAYNALNLVTYVHYLNITWQVTSTTITSCTITRSHEEFLSGYYFNRWVKKTITNNGGTADVESKALFGDMYGAPLYMHIIAQVDYSGRCYYTTDET